MKKVYVTATKITPHKIFYECPFCFKSSTGRIYNTNLNKNGKLIQSRKPNIHHHGNEYNKIDGNWDTERCSHCLINDTHVYIRINEETKRETI